jgi:hypothetical protein
MLSSRVITACPSIGPASCWTRKPVTIFQRSMHLRPIGAMPLEEPNKFAPQFFVVRARLIKGLFGNTEKAAEPFRTRL